ncbi:putative Domain (DUF3883) [Leishmania utingensis]|uniref:Domain (DUF3883) n=1 Tax=Leishmania utingensis TaxID=653362 RepID=A0AAW3AXP6_9TRYP
MQESDSGEQIQILMRVNEYVLEHRQAYRALSLDEQRRRGPLLLEDLLTFVMSSLLREVESREGDEDDADVHGYGRLSGVGHPRTSARIASGAHTLAAITSSINSLPFALRDVPALAHVAALQLRLTSSVMAAISTRAIVTVHELEEWVCAQEGVEHFAELGLGVGLQVLPVVQEYFQLRANSVVFPVRARDVIAFLLNDAAARDVLLYGGGDTRDLLNRFTAFYERHLLDGASSSSAPAAVRERKRLANVRQLGIHVQDYAALLASLTQELASAHQLEQQQYRQWMESCIAAATAITQGTNAKDTAVVVTGSGGGGEGALVRDASFEAAARWERNRTLYERVLQSLDSACAHAELLDSMRRTREKAVCASLAGGAGATPCITSAGARAMNFAVTVTEAEARSYSLPLSLWRTVPLDGEACSSLAGDKGGGGGVELRFHVGLLTTAEVSQAAHGPASGSTASTTLRMAPLPSQWTSSAVKGEGETPSQRVSNSGTSEVPPPPSTVHRRRGTVVCDTQSVISVGSLAVAAADAATAAETWRVASLNVAPALMSGTTTTSTATPTSAASLLSSLLKPAGSLGLAATSSVNTADATSSLSLQSTATAAESAPRVRDTPFTTEVVGSFVEVSTEPTTPLERLGDLLTQHRQSSALEKERGASVGEQAMISSTDDTWLDLVVAVFETFTAGDVVPMQLLCEAWATCMDCQSPGPSSLSSHSASAQGSTPGRYAHRRCIPLFHPFAASFSSSSGSTVPFSRLASLRRHFGTGGTSGASPAATSPTTRAGDGAAGETREILYMATPVEVCWFSWWGPALSDAHDSHEAAILTCACLERHYSSSLQSTFCGLLGVRAEPTVAAWCTTAAACARRLCPTATLKPSFTDAYVESFVRCVDADVAARVAEEGAATALAPFLLRRQQRTAQAALHRVLAGLQESLGAASPWRAGLFPCDHAWRCGLDGLLYATPQWCGYGGVLLTASSPPLPTHTSVMERLSKGGSGNGTGIAPSLRVLCFSVHEPSWAVCAVLHYLGIRSLSQLAETRVSFRTTVATEAGGVLHDKIAAIAPYVQSFCRASLPLWYGVVYEQLRERLRRLRVVLTATAGSGVLAASTLPVQTVCLHLKGHVYAHKRQIPLAYIAAHNVIYGAAEATPVPMLAEALLPLFMPVGMSAEADVRQLRDVIMRLLGALSSLDSSVEWCDGADISPQQQQWRREQVEHVLRPIAKRYGLTAFTGISREAPLLASRASASTEAAALVDTNAQDAEAEVPFTLSSCASIRYMPTYPPGTDALRQPRRRDRSHVGNPADQAPGTQTLTQASARELVAHAKPFSPQTAPRCRGGGGLVQRFGVNGRLRVTLSVGGSTAVVTSMPSWNNFPMELDLDAVVAASVVAEAADGGRRGADAAATACGHQQGDDADGDNSSVTSGSGGVGGREEEEQESFLTFQYHRRSSTASSALQGTGGGVRFRKRSRSGNVDATGHTRGKLRHDPAGRDVRSAGMWLRPPAASAVVGAGGDTPDYAVAAERYVYELLREEYATQAQQGGVRVIWVNEHCEAGSPFDILVIKPRRLSSTSSTSSAVYNNHWDVVQYVEVKSTCTAARQDFEMSMAELLFAARFGASYCVYRVFGASTDALRRMRHRIYTDIVNLWYKAQLTITSDIRVTPST